MLEDTNLINILMEYWLIPAGGLIWWELRQMRKRMEGLAISMGVSKTRLNSHEKRLDKLETSS